MEISEDLLLCTGRRSNAAPACLHHQVSPWKALVCYSQPGFAAITKSQRKMHFYKCLLTEKLVLMSKQQNDTSYLHVPDAQERHRRVVACGECNRPEIIINVHAFG